MDWTLTYFQYLLSVVLLFAGCSKLRSRPRLAETIRNYDLVPRAFARPVARALPELEIAIAVLLLADFLAGWAGVLASLLFLSFAGAIGVNLLRGRTDIDCGCFGPAQHNRLSWMHVLVNLLFAGGAAVIARTSWSDLDHAPIAPEERTSALLAAVVTLACWYLGSVSVRLWRDVIPRTE